MHQLQDRNQDVFTQLKTESKQTKDGVIEVPPVPERMQSHLADQASSGLKLRSERRIMEANEQEALEELVDLGRELNETQAGKALYSQLHTALSQQKDPGASDASQRKEQPEAGGRARHRAEAHPGRVGQDVPTNIGA